MIIGENLGEASVDAAEFAFPPSFVTACLCSEWATRQTFPANRGSPMHTFD
ncbi:protein of unknown function [Candidatus Methylacidiphilum fumarolicum]|uniref:Uncharacterized protein n=1 Tax=Candidatus Methylacidiphilum fumarolicum TaxID=591154 RepID=A0ABM9IAU4_9BACT|nr:protein of unknown function [Candidatus Methylacidiphilum fumarolicum]